MGRVYHGAQEVKTKDGKTLYNPIIVVKTVFRKDGGPPKLNEITFSSDLTLNSKKDAQIFCTEIFNIIMGKNGTVNLRQDENGDLDV